MTNNLTRFIHYFEVNHFTRIERANNIVVSDTIRRYAAGDVDMEFDLGEELFGPEGYLMCGR